jgi:hypothetical protein
VASDRFSEAFSFGRPLGNAKTILVAVLFPYGGLFGELSNVSSHTPSLGLRRQSLPRIQQVGLAEVEELRPHVSLSGVATSDKLLRNHDMVSYRIGLEIVFLA